MVEEQESDKLRFEKLVRENFDFLQDTPRMKFSGVRSIGGDDPRDAGLVARYSRDDLRVDVGWSKLQSSLTVSLKFEDADIPRKLRHLYFEPFIEFFTQGKDRAIVPYIREGMSIKKILSVSTEREKVFQDGLPAVIKAVGRKLRLYFNQIESVPVDLIGKYHDWIAAKRFE